MRCFIQDLSLISILDLFLHWSSFSRRKLLALSAAMLTQGIRSKMCSFHLMYLSKVPMNLTSTG